MLPFHFEAETRETGLMDLLLIVADLCRLRIAIESNGLLQGDPRCLFKRIPSLFLKVDSWYLLNPSDPIGAKQLDDGGVCHFSTSLAPFLRTSRNPFLDRISHASFPEMILRLANSHLKLGDIGFHMSSFLDFLFVSRLKK